ncbi:4Fe-4S binding protein [uncultured Alistipes sp.]|uniref:4Fe-4S binding protein n=1 Tax=uncultured Alistipes sp. TaxID=538949 RepID=UPI00259ACF00|nr:4Fe-4S binding protein [uncultured Alistipes sp.]
MQPSELRTLFFSPTGTTRRVADAIAQAAADGSPVVATDLTHTKAPALTFGPDTVAILAAPVYGGHIPPLAFERLAEIRGNDTPAIIAVVYGNRDFGKAAVELAEFARHHGFRPIAAAAFVGEHSYSSPAAPIAAGRPDADDMAVATAFGANIRAKLRAEQPATVDAARLKTPRTSLLSLLRFIRFVLAYRRRQRKNPVVRIPVGDAARCTRCGRCAALCPTQAIARGDELHTDPQRCIRCCACVKGCPTGARSYETPFADALARNFSRRKPPVTLL